MSGDEERAITWQSLSVVDALSRPRLRHFRWKDGQPGRAGRCLFFEFAQKGRVDVGCGENANGRAGESVLARREDGVKTRVVARHLVNALCGIFLTRQKEKKKCF